MSKAAAEDKLEEVAPIGAILGNLPALVGSGAITVVAGIGGTSFRDPLGSLVAGVLVGGFLGGIAGVLAGIVAAQFLPPRLRAVVAGTIAYAGPCIVTPLAVFGPSQLAPPAIAASLVIGVGLGVVFIPASRKQGGAEQAKPPGSE